LTAAIGCLTILPFGPRGHVQPADLGGSLAWFPLVGLLIGAVLASANVFASRLFSPLVVGACILFVWVILTGALHLDGVGDVADGLYGGRTREARLRIMKDPHIGAIGVVTVAVLLILKFALVSSLPSATMDRTLLLTPCLGRYMMVLLASTLPYARTGEGTAAAFVRYATPRALIGATAVAVPAASLLLGVRGVVLFGVAFLGSLIMRRVFLRTLGGITGDALGATGEVSEVLILLVAALTTG